MITRILAIVAVLMLPAGCVANPESPAAPRDEANPPFMVDGKMVTQQDIDRSLEVGQRVIIIFQDYNTSNGVQSCPVKIRTIDNVCAEAAYQNSDPTVICRATQDSDADDRNKKIVWQGEGEFTVEFEGDIAPCRAGWDGNTPKNWHICQLQDSTVFKVVKGLAAFVKYTVQGPAGCAALDPFFIVRH
jgi:hypothetical protein